MLDRGQLRPLGQRRGDLALRESSRRASHSLLADQLAHNVAHFQSTMRRNRVELFPFLAAFYVAAGVASLFLAAFSLTLPHTPPKPAKTEDATESKTADAAK